MSQTLLGPPLVQCLYLGHEISLARSRVSSSSCLDVFCVFLTKTLTMSKVGNHPLERELVIPFGGSGYVALFEIVSEREVAVCTVRHQREDDCH